MEVSYAGMRAVFDAPVIVSGERLLACHPEERSDEGPLFRAVKRLDRLFVFERGPSLRSG